MRHHVVGGVRLGHPLAQELTKKDPGKRAHHQEDQSGDREHELGLQSHGDAEPCKWLIELIERH